METLGALFVHRPLRILLVALVLLAAHVGLRISGAGSRPGGLLAASASWAVYAGWEYLVVTRSPEANIRVDLLLIWSVLLVLTIWP